MKKILSIILVILMIAPCLLVFVGCIPRERTLKILNWADYIDEGDVDEDREAVTKLFEKWYFDNYGEKIKVDYNTAETNEEMFLELSSGGADYDLVCPSEYMIERMAKADLLQKINKDNIPNAQYVSSYITETIGNQFKTSTFDINDYYIGYMWGTMGILYNPSRLRAADRNSEYMGSWSTLWDANYKNEILMKNSQRDVFIIACLMMGNGSTEQDYLNDLVNNINAAKISDILTLLKQQKGILKGYEVDEGKNDMVDGTATMALMWSGDAVYAIDEAKTKRGIDLEYVVPREGSNVFFDGWVIPKKAVNVGLAELFLDFICSPEIVIANMDYIGYCSVIAHPDVADYYAIDGQGNDYSYFFGEGFEDICLDDVLYPTFETLQRCVIMRDFGEYNAAITEMWNSLKAYNP